MKPILLFFALSGGATILTFIALAAFVWSQ
jgi:hypothetical protein